MHSFKKISPPWAKTLYHQISWRYRDLPDFIIIGAMKSGSTSLFYYLSQHPQLVRSYAKEVHFFDGGTNPNIDNFQKGEAWYRSHFPQKQDIKKNQKTFEASPLYFYNPLAPKRIFDLLPDVKLITILRNPTERAISHYFHTKRYDREPLPIIEALLSEEERLQPIISKQDYKNLIFRTYSYKSRGIYHAQLKRYLNYFPMSNILVLSSEHLLAEPNETLRRVYKFLNIDTEFMVDDLRLYNVGSNRIDVDPSVREYLDDYFRPHNQVLYELVGQNFGW